jgi:hypothetical protein
VLKSYRLMRSPHSEGDATDYCTIPVSAFSSSNYIPNSTNPLRIYLEQPSPLWKTFSLKNITVQGTNVVGKKHKNAWAVGGTVGLLRNNPSHAVADDDSDSAEEHDPLHSPPSRKAYPSAAYSPHKPPGLALDKIHMMIKESMSLVRERDALEIGQRTAFLEINKRK